MNQLPDQPGRDRTWMTEYEKAAVAYAEAGGELPLAPRSDLDRVNLVRIARAIDRGENVGGFALGLCRGGQ